MDRCGVDGDTDLANWVLVLAHGSEAGRELVGPVLRDWEEYGEDHGCWAYCTGSSLN